MSTETTMAQDLEAKGIRDPGNSAARGALVSYINRATKEEQKKRVRFIVEMQQKYEGKKVTHQFGGQIREGVVEYIRPARVYADFKNMPPQEISPFEACIKWRGQKAKTFHRLNFLKIVS